ncbi:hypothetical protein [Alteribacter natronophilus]|uniref:hypothetical protein n=1 Tax=Alteribacter natronophilus TaxID=2583810 RepID=UPI00110D5540|nr:hypothetical protein [Alteribacter natronophilus]TMW72781.1 hypothetical protein FGB90_00260 [Alteribacter natronophilus]
MEKKQYAGLLAVITVIIFAVFLFREPAQSEQVSESVDEKEPAEEHDQNQEESDEEFDYIDYLNIEAENRALKEQLEWMEEELFITNFENMKLRIKGGVVQEDLPYPETAEILYQDVEEEKYVLLYKDERGFHLIVSLLENRIWEYFGFYGLNTAEDFNWSIGVSNPHGFISDPDITSVQVLEDEEVWESEIITVNKDLRVWYSLADTDMPTNSDEPENLRIEALDEAGNVISSDSFNW